MTQSRFITMMNEPAISVIIPVWNRQDLIIRCLDSVINQTVKPFEIIVVDNSSTDDTYKTVELWMNSHSDAGVKFSLLSEVKKGACAARQRGFENAAGNYVFFFDSDDMMKPLLIEKVASKLKAHPGIDIVCWKARINQLDGTERVPPFEFNNPLEYHLIHTLLRPQGYLVKKEFFNSAGAWTKPVEVWNDLELGLRLLLKNPSITGVNEVLAEIYSQEESITGEDFSSKEGKWEITLEEMNRDADISNHPLKDKIRRILDYRRAILAAHYSREGNHKGAHRLMTESTRGKSFGEKLILKFSYNYTRLGLRGVWRIVGKFY